MLVPWRAGDPVREQAWSHVKPALGALGWPIFTGDTGGEFSRSAACNAAAAAAGEWDVAVVADADTYHPLAPMRLAVDAAHESGRAVVPWDRRHKLNEFGSANVVFTLEGVADVGRLGDPSTAERYEPGEEAAPWNQPSYPIWRRGGAIVIPRAAWEMVGGFDEGFRRWGHEDCAQRLALGTLAGLMAVEGDCWHLYHAPVARERHYGFRENRDRFRRYQSVEGEPGLMRDLLVKLGVVA